MLTKHTKGQWYVSGGDKYATIESRNMDEKIVVTYPTIATVNSTFINVEEFRSNAKLISHAPELLQMVSDLKDCIKRLTNDDISQFDRDKEAYWIGEAHELLTKVNPDYYKNANS